MIKMPGGNGTGPQGRGPLTGRGMGNCSGSNASNSASYGRGFGFGAGRGGGRGGGRGFGRGFNRGFGWGYQYPVQITPEEQARNLENEKIYLRDRLKEVEELEKTMKTTITP